MRAIKAGEFKTHCLSLLDDVARGKEALVVTKRGKAVAVVSPVPTDEPAAGGGLAGSVVFEGDLVSPLGVDWEADQDSP